MKISKEKLQQEAASTGFKMEHLEKVHMLMDLLADFASFPQLLLDNGIIKPELISDDLSLVANIKNHPAIKWSAQQRNEK